MRQNNPVPGLAGNLSDNIDVQVDDAVMGRDYEVGVTTNDDGSLDYRENFLGDFDPKDKYIRASLRN